jgi:hypothetical protein
VKAGMWYTGLEDERLVWLVEKEKGNKKRKKAKEENGKFRRLGGGSS